MNLRLYQAVSPQCVTKLLWLPNSSHLSYETEMTSMVFKSTFSDFSYAYNPIQRSLIKIATNQILLAPGTTSLCCFDSHSNSPELM